MRLVRFLLGREQSFEKNDQQLSASIEVRESCGNFPTPLTSRAYLEAMREILSDIRGFSGVLDSVAGSMTDLSRNIMEYVKPRALEPCSYSRISGDHKPRRNHDPDFSTADRTAGARAIRGQVAALCFKRLLTNRCLRWILVFPVSWLRCGERVFSLSQKFH
jgi:hypothetical protein